MTKELRYSAILLLTAFIWGIGFVAQRAAMDHMGPFTFNAVRFGLGALALIPVIMIMEKGFDRATVKAGLIVGVILFFAAALQQWGIAATGSAAKSGFITGLYIILTPILGIFFGRNTHKFVWLGAILATFGIYFIANPGTLGFDLGVVALLACAVVWAIHILAIGHYAASIKPLGFTSMQCAICAIFSTFAAFVFEDVQFAQITAGYIPILYSGLVSVFIAYTLQVVAQRHVAPAKSAVIFSMESVFGAGGEALILGAFLDVRGYIGGILIFAGIIVSQLVSFGRKMNGKYHSEADK